MLSTSDSVYPLNGKLFLLISMNAMRALLASYMTGLTNFVQLPTKTLRPVL